jgi:hypothetical protein
MEHKPMDECVEAFLADVLALEGEPGDAAGRLWMVLRINRVGRTLVYRRSMSWGKFFVVTLRTEMAISF